MGRTGLLPVGEQRGAELAENRVDMMVRTLLRTTAFRPHLAPQRAC